jgi:hypothetical protein
MSATQDEEWLDLRPAPQRASVFLSYARTDEAAAAAISQKLQLLDVDVWHDTKTGGGEAWWAKILEQVERCDLVVFVASPDSKRSRWCHTELTYAQSLGRPILPVIVRPVDLFDVPGVQQSQGIEFVVDSGEAGIRLATAVTALVARKQALPDPMPDRPEMPFPSLAEHRESLSRSRMTFEQQSHVFQALRARLDDGDQGDAAAELLVELLRRPDLVAALERDVEDALRKRRLSARQRRAGGTDLVRSLLTHIRAGQCTPITGFGMTDSLLCSRDAIAAQLSSTSRGFDPLRCDIKDALMSSRRVASSVITDANCATRARSSAK